MERQVTWCGSTLSLYLVWVAVCFLCVCVCACVCTCVCPLPDFWDVALSVFVWGFLFFTNRHLGGSIWHFVKIKLFSYSYPVTTYFHDVMLFSLWYVHFGEKKVLSTVQSQYCKVMKCLMKKQLKICLKTVLCFLYAHNVLKSKTHLFCHLSLTEAIKVNPFRSSFVPKGISSIALWCVEKIRTSEQCTQTCFCTWGVK